MLSKIDKSNSNGNQVLQALDMIKTGLSKLEAQDGTRLQANAVSAEEFETVFGVTTGGGAQLSARWDSLLAWKNGTGALTSAVLNDLIDSVVAA